MADVETSSDNNGSFKLKLSEHRFIGITGKDAVYILFVVLIAAMAYLRTQTIDKHLSAIQTGQIAFTKELYDQNTKVDNQTEMLKQMLLRINYNLGRSPAEQLPIDSNISLPQR